MTFYMQVNEERVKRIHQKFQSIVFLIPGHVDDMLLYKILFIWTNPFSHSEVISKDASVAFLSVYLSEINGLYNSLFDFIH